MVRFLHLFKFGLVVFTEFVSVSAGSCRETPPCCFFIAVKTPFTLNASADLSALMDICSVAYSNLGLCYRAICVLAHIARYHNPTTSCLQISLRLVCSQLVKALVVGKLCCADML